MAYNRNELLWNLTKALAQYPNATMQELAKMVGVSKASLHRIYSTRENLLAMISEKAHEMDQPFLDMIEKNTDFYTTLRNLIKLHCDYSVYVIWMCRDIYWSNDIDGETADIYFEKLEKFFRGGQEEGFISTEYTPSDLTGLFISIVTGMLDSQLWGLISERRVRKLIELSLLKGIAK